MEDLNLDVLDGKEVKKLIALNEKIVKTKNAIENIEKNLQLQADTLINGIKNKLKIANPNYIFVEDLSDELEQRACFVCKKADNNCLDGNWIGDAKRGNQRGGFALHIEHGILS